MEHTQHLHSVEEIKVTVKTVKVLAVFSNRNIEYQGQMLGNVEKFHCFQSLA